MSIQSNSVYSVKEASNILGVSTRKLHRIGLKHNISKIDNRYIFKGSFLIEHFKLTPGETLARSGEWLAKFKKENTKQYDIEIESLKIENERLTNELKNIKSIKNIELFKLDKIEDFDFEFNKVKGNLVFIPKDRVYEDFSPEEYNKMSEVIIAHPYITKEVKTSRDEIKYLRESLISKEIQFKLLIQSGAESVKSLQQQQFINAKDKGYDKDH